MDTLLIVAQTPQGDEIPLKALDREREEILEAQAQAVGMDLAGWVSLLLEASTTIYPDDIEPGRKAEPVEQPPGARRVQLNVELLARLAGPEWSPSPHVGVTDWIGLTCALAAMEPENGAAVQALAAQGQTAPQIAHALLTMEWEDLEALAGTEGVSEMAVYQRNGTYWIDYYFQDRRYRQKIGSRRKDAEEALSRVRVNIAAGEFIPPEERKREEAFQRQPMLFETFAQEEFLPWSEADHSTGHHNQQRIILRVHLAPYFEGMHLHEITPKRIEDYKGARVKKANRATVNREVFCLKKLLRKAVEWGKLEENPATGIKSFKETPQAPRLLEVEEVARLQEACRQESCPVDLYALVCCIVYAGLRKAEVLNLRWDGIDWKREELTVQSRPEWHTKNYQSRTIPMSEMLAEALRSAPRRLGCALVFPTPEGATYKNTHYIEVALDRATVRAGIEGGVTFHQLRHTFCSHAQMQGVPARTVQKWMGHRDLRTTLRYSHTSAGHEKAAMKQLRYESSHQVDTNTGQQ